MRKVAASLFRNLDGRAEHSDEFVSGVHGATEENLRSVSR
jgi:hypothetical protein